MAEYRLRPKARSDTDAIWNYTVKARGVQQAHSYIAELRNVCTELTNHPELGKCRDELQPGLRVYPSGKHLIFYLTLAGNIDIVRILHESMDTCRRLSPAPMRRGS